MMSAGLALGGCATKGDGASGGDGIADGADDGAEDGVGSTGGADDGPDGAEEEDDDADPGDTVGDTAGDSGGDSDDGPDSGISFISPPDGEGPGFECDLFSQDCPDGEKCMPWANDGGSAWNATRCSPLDDAPGQAGDECSVEGSGVSGLDDCDLGVMCWDVDPETNLGTCAAMCQGDQANPICEDPDTTCVIANEGAIVLCLPICHPLTQDCPDGQACYPINNDFACAPNVAGEGGVHGDPCEFVNVCQIGLACVNPDLFTNCPSGGCCSSYCDATNPGADADCMALDAGQSCIEWYAEGEAPPGYDDTGICGIPI